MEAAAWVIVLAMLGFYGPGFAVLELACLKSPRKNTARPEEASFMALTLTSPAFEHGQAIPRRYTCEGDDISPPLEWAGLPERAKSLALIVDDHDAPDPAALKRVRVHWVVYDIPASTLERSGRPTGDSNI